MKRGIWFVASVWLCCLASAWDGNGHRIVAVIAHKRLSELAAGGDAKAKAALAKLDALLAKCPAGYREIGLAATYPDDVKSKTHDYDAYHYNDVEITTFGGKWQSFDETVGVMQGIALAESVLKGTHHPKVPWGEDPGINLMFVLHFVGDVHQPLHMGENGDKGGNQTFLDFGGDGPHRQKLHSYWDDVATRHYSAPYTPAGKVLVGWDGTDRRSDAAHILAVADELVAAYPPEAAGAADLNHDHWAQESLKLAHDVAYKFDLSSGEPWIETRNGRRVERGKVYKAPAGYAADCTKVGLARLVLAGYRLAGELRELLG